MNTTQTLTTLNLNKAHKVLDKLKAALTKKSGFRSRNSWDSSSSSSGVQHFENSVSKTYVHQPFEQFMTELKHMRDESQQNIQNYIALLEDVTQLRTSLFTANVTSGVHAVLNRMEIVKKQIKMWQHIRDSSLTSALQNEQVFDTLVKRVESGLISNFEVPLSVYEDNVIESKLYTFAKELNVLEDKRDRLNATTKIEIPFSTISLQTLGM